MATEETEKRRAYAAEYYRRNRDRYVARRPPPEQRRGEHFKRMYGITPADYDRMLIDQDGVCAICRTPPKRTRLHVDHDHETGRVRGILCGPCNGALHYIERNGWLDTAIQYLNRFPKEHTDHVERDHPDAQ